MIPCQRISTFIQKAKRKLKLSKFDLSSFKSFLTLFSGNFLLTPFRHPSIMENPIAIVSKLKIDEYVWDYVVARSFYLQNDRRDDNLK